MSIYDKFINAAVAHPEWEVIRSELCKPLGDPTVIDLGGGASVWLGPPNDSTEEENRKSELFGELCWWINNGPGYCETAPAHIKKYLRRLNIKV